MQRFGHAARARNFTSPGELRVIAVDCDRGNLHNNQTVRNVRMWMQQQSGHAENFPHVDATTMWSCRNKLYGTSACGCNNNVVMQKQTVQRPHVDATTMRSCINKLYGTSAFGCNNNAVMQKQTIFTLLPSTYQSINQSTLFRNITSIYKLC